MHRTIFDLGQSNSSPFGRIWDDIEAAGAYLSAMNVHNAHNLCYCEHNVVVGRVAKEPEASMQLAHSNLNLCFEASWIGNCEKAKP